MLQVTLFEFFTRGLPEGFLFIFAIYTFSKRYIDIGRYIVSSIIYVVVVYTIRFLPINFGVHTILNFFVFTILIVNVNKFNLFESVRSVTIALILLFVCEGLNILIVQHIFKADMNYIFNKPVLKVLYGTPAILIFACVVTSYYGRLLKRKELKHIY